MINGAYDVLFAGDGYGLKRSKITVRANATVSGMVRKMIAAIHGVSPPHRRRANQKSTAAVASVNR